jgi:hypothetical protein
MRHTCISHNLHGGVESLRFTRDAAIGLLDRGKQIGDNRASWVGAGEWSSRSWPSFSEARGTVRVTDPDPYPLSRIHNTGSNLSLCSEWRKRGPTSKILHIFQYRYRVLMIFTVTNKLYTGKQCSGSMTFWGGSGSADLCLWLIDPDSDPNPGSGSCYFSSLTFKMPAKN